MHHSQRDSWCKFFIRRPSQDLFLRIQNLYYLGIIQKEKDRNNWKQENPLTDLMYETLCKGWDGLHKIMSYTYLSPMDMARLNAGYLESWQEKTRLDSLECTVVGKGRTELNSLQESTLGHKRTSCNCAGAAPDYIEFPIQPRICILANQETNSCNLRLWFWYCWLPLRQQTLCFSLQVCRWIISVFINKFIQVQNH